MMGRIAWYAALGLIAALVTVLQIDKQSEFSPELAVLVPQPLRNYGQVHIVRGALAGADAAQGLDEAKRLVARRPVPAEYLTLLAGAQAKAGKGQDAALTIQIAARRGWREPVAQEAMLRLALSAGDEAEAARRYAALFLRPATPDALLKEVGPLVLGEAGGVGQKALVTIVTGGERWHPLFLRRGPIVMPPAAFSAIAAGSLAQGAAFDCGLLARSIDMVRQGDAQAASTLEKAAQERCPAPR